MELAGLEISDTVVLDLAIRLHRADYPYTADLLEGAVGDGLKLVPLTIPDRIAILAALDDPPSKAFAELRGILLAEHVGRVRDGLA